MAGPRVYYDLMSQPSRAVVLYLKVCNIPYVDNVLALRKGEHISGEYGKINPLHLVPAIDDNGFILTESIAILKYLHAKYRPADHWFPENIQKRARVEEYLNWYHLNTRMNAAFVFRTKVIEPRAKNVPVDEERLRKFSAQLDTTLAAIESIFLKDQDYIAGDDISIADIMSVCEIMQPHASGYNIYTDRPKIKAWVERCKARLQPHFDEVHKPLGRVLAVFGGKNKL